MSIGIRIWRTNKRKENEMKFEPWRSEAEHATSRSRRLPTILTFTRGWGRNNFCFFQTAETGNRTPDSGVKGGGANHYPRAPAQQTKDGNQTYWQLRVGVPNKLQCWLTLVHCQPRWLRISPIVFQRLEYNEGNVRCHNMVILHAGPLATTLDQH